MLPVGVEPVQPIRRSPHVLVADDLSDGARELGGGEVAPLQHPSVAVPYRPLQVGPLVVHQGDAQDLGLHVVEIIKLTLILRPAIDLSKLQLTLSP